MRYRIPSILAVLITVISLSVPAASAVARPDISATGIAIQQTTITYGTICLTTAYAPSVNYSTCPPYYASQVWTRQSSTNGQYKIVQGTTCLDGSPSNPGLQSCQQGNGYQKWNLVKLADGFEWKIEQPHGSTNICLTTNANMFGFLGFETCQRGDDAQKFTFPQA